MKIVKILIISFCIMLFLTQNIFATATETIQESAKSWISDGLAHAGIGIDTSNLKDKSSNIYNLLLFVAIAVAVIVGAILGIQYMTAGIEEKVKVKESLFPYMISCIVAFGSIGIWKIMIEISKLIV